MLVRLLEPAFDPRKDLDVGRVLVELPVDRGWLVSHEPKLAQRAPVPSEQLQERRLSFWADPVRADDSLISHATKY